MDRALRKLEHIKLAVETLQSNLQGFNDVKFVHQALPDSSLEEANVTTSIGGLNLSSPIIINAMTGGANETTEINRQLATIAKETGLALAVGSQMSAIKDKQYRPTYEIVRKVNPDGIIFANLGAEATVEQAMTAIELVEANVLQIHLNTVQELIMPEGERAFTGILERIRAIKETIKVPVIVKEVGFGISKEVAAKLYNEGIKIIDVGGKGGTNFALIENKRRNEPLTFFNDWGITTAASILEVNTVADIEIIATGGIQESIHIAKAIGLGASAVGLAGIILKLITTEGMKGTINYIHKLHQELKYIMTSLGAKSLLELQHKPIIISGELKNWCDLRNLSPKSLANRK